MFRIDDATAATSLPTPEAAGTEGFWTEGNPATGVPATLERASWFNMIQEELCAILAAAGIARSKTSYNQVNTALQKMYSPVVGTVRNLVMNVAAASATATLSANEIVVGAAPGGQKYILPSFSKTINLATTGAGGMDIGTAPVSGYVALYAIYNPTTGTSALLATDATSAIQSNVYGGANMPSGYTASALISVWQTNASSQFQIGIQRDRRISFPFRTLYSSTTIAGSITPLSIAGAVPMNAIRVGTSFGVGSATVAQTYVIYMFSTSGAIGQQQMGGYSPAGGGTGTNGSLDISSAQTVYYQGSPTSGATFSLYASWYEF